MSLWTILADLSSEWITRKCFSRSCIVCTEGTVVLTLMRLACVLGWFVFVLSTSIAMVSASTSTALYITVQSCSYANEMNVLHIVDKLLGSSPHHIVQEGQVFQICAASKEVNLWLFVVMAGLLSIFQVIKG